MEIEIKFRFWDKKTNFLYPISTLEEVSKKMEVNNSLIPLEFTGFIIKNKLELFDGYIVEYNFTLDGTKKIKAPIYFDQEVGAWYCGNNLLSTVLHEQENDEWKKQMNFSIKENQYLKVIGNIYENPELINL